MILFIAFFVCNFAEEVASDFKLKYLSQLNRETRGPPTTANYVSTDYFKNGPVCHTSQTIRNQKNLLAIVFICGMKMEDHLLGALVALAPQPFSVKVGYKVKV